MIISASRRTDIPAFFGDWFMDRLKEGSCSVANPYNPSQVSEISLMPADVDAIVFWTKDPAPFIRRLEEIDSLGYRYYFLFTLNDYPGFLEPGIPSLEERLETFRGLAGRIGPARVVWRYDPIILSEQMGAEYHLEVFQRIADGLTGCTERVIISFVDFYRKAERRLAKIERDTGEGFCRDVYGYPGLADLVAGMLEIAKGHGLQLRSCAEPSELEALGVRPGKCIDDKLIEQVFGIQVAAGKDRGQRDKCLCVKSRDIGTNNTCRHGCAYCYSVSSEQ